MQVRKKAFQGSKEQCCFFDNFFCVHSLVRSCTKNGAGLGTAPVSAVVLGPQAKILLTGSTIARRSGFFKAAACAANPRPAPTSSVIYGKYLIIFFESGRWCVRQGLVGRSVYGGSASPAGVAWRPEAAFRPGSVVRDGTDRHRRWGRKRRQVQRGWPGRLARRVARGWGPGRGRLRPLPLFLCGNEATRPWRPLRPQPRSGRRSLAGPSGRAAWAGPAG